MDLKKIFFTSKERILETFCQVFATVIWLQWEWFCFQVSWWFSC